MDVARDAAIHFGGFVRQNRKRKRLSLRKMGALMKPPMTERRLWTIEQMPTPQGIYDDSYSRIAEVLGMTPEQLDEWQKTPVTVPAKGKTVWTLRLPIDLRAAVESVSPAPDAFAERAIRDAVAKLNRPTPAAESAAVERKRAEPSRGLLLEKGGRAEEVTRKGSRERPPKKGSRGKRPGGRHRDEKPPSPHHTKDEDDPVHRRHDLGEQFPAIRGQ